MSRAIHPGANKIQPPRSWDTFYVTATEILPNFLLLLGIAACDLDDVFQDVLFAAHQRFEHFDPAWQSTTRSPAPTPSCGEAHVPPPCTPAGGMPSAPFATAPPRGSTGKPTPEGKWLYGVSWRQVRHYLERAYRRRELSLELTDVPCFERADPGLGADLRLAAEERRALAIDLLASVRPQRRVVLVLKDAFDLPVDEIADTLKLRKNTAYIRLRLARRDYRAAVKRLPPEQRRALEVSGFAFFFFPEDLLRAVVAPTDDADPENAPGVALRKRWLAEWPERLRRALGAPHRRLLWLVAVSAVAAPLLLAPAPPTVALARRFGPILLPWAQRVHASVHPGSGPLDPEPRTPATPPRATTATATARHEVPASAPGPVRPGLGHVAEEQPWIDAAQEALVRGDFRGALKQLAEHARRFPRGQLRPTRERLRAQAMSALGSAPKDAPEGGQP